MASNPIIGLEFEYKKSLDAMISELEKRLQELDKFGSKAGFTNKWSQDLEGIQKDLKGLKDEFGSIEKNIPLGEKLKGFETETNEALVKTQKAVDDLSKKISDLHTAFELLDDNGVEFADKIGMISESFDNASQSIGETLKQAESIKELFSLVSTGIPKLDIGANPRDLKTLASLKMALQDIQEAQEESATTFSSVEDYVGRAKEAYQHYIEATNNLAASEAKAQTRTGTALNEERKKIIEFKADVAAAMLETVQFEEALYDLKKRDFDKVISGFGDAFSAKELENDKPFKALIETIPSNVPQKLDAFLSLVHNRFDSEFNQIISDVDTTIKHAEGMVGSADFKVKNGAIYIPLSIAKVTSDHTAAIQNRIDKLQKYADEHPLEIKVAVSNSDTTANVAKALGLEV